MTESEQAPLARVFGKALKELPQDLYIPPDALEVFLEAFAGPLDLLLYLIRKQNIDILDIPVAEITRQYMSYVEMMQAARLDLAAEYLVMAAMLAEIKSRLLLPRPPAASEEEQDPRAELIRRLQAYERCKQAAELLDALPRVEREIILAHLPAPTFAQPKRLPEVTLEALLQALAEVIQRSEHLTHHQVSREALSVRLRMSELLAKLRGAGFVPFSQLLQASEGRLGLVVSFMALLELVKEALVELVQNADFSTLHLRAKGYDQEAKA